MNRFLPFIILLVCVLLQNCDNSITIKTQAGRAIASAVVVRIDGTEKIPNGVKELLFEEQNLHNKDLWGANAFASNIDPKYVPEANPKFPLPYYLIPDTDAKFLFADSLNTKVADQLSMLISGTRYYKLFVHPESEAHYAFLRNAYRYIGSEETEFMASPTSSYRSLVVWNESNSKKRPFIAKVSLDKNVIGGIDRLVSENEVERSVANQKVFDRLGKANLEGMNVKIFPESAGLLFKRPMGGAPKKLGGQLIREIPEEVLKDEMKWLSFSALMSPNRKPPLIMKVISQSGLSSFDFFEKYMIKGYLEMFENLSLKNGVNFEPHSQNLVFETTNDFKPTGKWVLRDFGGVWTDPVAMAKNGGPIDIYMQDASASKYKLKGGRGNYISSYVFFYKRQVFDMMLEEVAKFDPLMTPEKVSELKNKIDTAYLKQINSYLKLKLKVAPDMTTYQKIEQMVLDQTGLDRSVNKKELDNTSALRAFLDRKKDNKEWVDLANSARGKSTFYLTDHGVYEISDEKIVGLALFNQNELNKFKNNNGMLPEFLPNTKYWNTGKCFDVIKNFFR